MFRALAVSSAALWLVMAPLAEAAAHHAASSQKAHKHSAGATPSAHKARLRKTSDVEAPAHGKKGRGRHAKSTIEAPDGPVTRSVRHRKGKHAADEDQVATTAKGKHHRWQDVAAGESEAPAPKGRHGRALNQEVLEAHTRSGGGSVGIEDEGPGPALRSDTRVAASCYAMHVKAHGKPKGSRARAALRRQCLEEARALRRKRELEIAIRSWQPPRGPLIYPGALPKGNGAVPDPALQAAETPSAPVADPNAPTIAQPGGAPLNTAATSLTPSQPAQAAATLQQPQQPAAKSGGGFLGGLFGRGKHDRPKDGPAPTMATLMGSDEAKLRTELGDPELMRAEGDGALWTYKLPGCALYVFLGRDAAASPWKVKGAEAGPLKRGGPSPEVDVCLKSARS